MLCKRDVGQRSRGEMAGFMREGMLSALVGSESTASEQASTAGLGRFSLQVHSGLCHKDSSLLRHQKKSCEREEEIACDPNSFIYESR